MKKSLNFLLFIFLFSCDNIDSKLTIINENSFPIVVGIGDINESFADASNNEKYKREIDSYYYYENKVVSGSSYNLITKSNWEDYLQRDSLILQVYSLKEVEAKKKY